MYGIGWLRLVQYLPTGCERFLHSGNRFRSKRLNDALPLLHVGENAQRFINILPRTPLCQSLRNHLLGAWLTSSDNHNSYGDEILKITF